MTNGPDEPGQNTPPPPPPPPSSGGRGLFARNDPDSPGPTPPPPPPPPAPPERFDQELPPPPPPISPRRDPRVQQPVAGADDNPFLLPNERDRMPVYGAAPPLPVIPLALMVLAIVVGGALIYMSMGDKKDSGGITPQQASQGLVLHLDGVDVTEDAFRRELTKGISKGRIPCEAIAGQAADNIAAGFRLGALRMEIPTSSGVAAKKDQKADDASLLIAANLVKETCPKSAAPAAAPGTQPQGQPVPGSQPQGQPIPGGNNPAPAGTTAPAPSGGTQPNPAGTARPATTPAPGAGLAPAATPRP